MSSELAAAVSRPTSKTRVLAEVNKKMSPLFFSVCFSQRSQEKKCTTITYSGEHNNFIAINRTHAKSIHPSKQRNGTLPSICRPSFGLL